MDAPRTKRRMRNIAIVAAVSLLTIAFVFQPLAIHLAQASAKERGWALAIRGVRPGTRGIWFKNLSASQPAISDLHVRIGAVLVPWSRLASRDALVVVGGTVTLPERLEALSNDLSPKAGVTRSRARQLQVHVSGITVTWASAGQQQTRATAWGVAGDLKGESAKLSIDRLETFRKDVACLLVGANVGMRREPAGWKLESFKIDQAKIDVSTGGDSGAPSSLANTTSAVDHAKAIAAPSPDAIERFVALMHGLQARVGRLRQFVANRIAAQAGIEASSVSLRWSHAAQSLNVGPFQLKSRNESGELTVTLEQAATAMDERRSIELRLPPTPSRIEFKSDIGFVSLRALGVQEADFGLEHVDAAKLRLNVSSSIDEVAASATMTATGELADLSVRQPWLASRTVSGIRAEFAGNASVTWNSGTSLRIDDWSLQMGRARVEVNADIRRSGRETSAKIDVSVPLAACEDLVESLPDGLAPLASQVRLDGTLALHAGVNFDTEHPQRTDAKWELSNGCRVRTASALVSPQRFREPFILEVPDASGAMVERAFGPGTPNWVPYAEMTKHLSSAVLVCEDGRFFHHNGFDSQAIRNSIRDNLLHGRFMRGGSTISMQLTKNLYLRREKTVSRKLQEAALTLLLEQSFSKNEIMELYWNVAELGPGIYGIGEASTFYFGTTPDALTPAQAFYIASILPKPKALHFAPDSNVTPGWLSQVRRLMTIAHGRHYLTDEELHQALEEDLHFGSSPDRPQPTATDAPNAGGISSGDSYEGSDREPSP
jgi:hypothetical protein